MKKSEKMDSGRKRKSVKKKYGKLLSRRNVLRKENFLFQNEMNRLKSSVKIDFAFKYIKLR